MGKMYVGRVPGDDWDLIGTAVGDKYKFLIFEKPCTNINGEITGYINWKVVLEEGKQLRKGNYWLYINPNNGDLVQNNDSEKMVNHMPKLYQNILDLLHKLYA